MLSKILKKSDCAACRFCCSFRRQSLWETPVFDAETVEKLRKLYPHAKFRNEGSVSFTFDISDQYKTSLSDEEAPCPFLDTEKGCVLPPELKPFDCTIWPFRAVRVSGVSSSREEAHSVSGGRDTSVSGGGYTSVSGGGQAALDNRDTSVSGGVQPECGDTTLPACRQPTASVCEDPPASSKNGQIVVALTPTCPAINSVPRRQITELLDSGLGETILAYAENHPDIIKAPTEFLSDIVYKRAEP